MLKTFLDNKPLFYDEIDYTRMPRIYEKIKSNLSQSKIIHIIGTNGKGTTGRFLASSLETLGFSVGHYTSPHILEFNERIWLNGSYVDDETLNNAHKKLQSILTKEDSNALSYFEYTTFIAMVIYDGLDYVVLEAGLGGEWDATAVFEKSLTLVTPIDIDHEAFLGNTIKEIASTKLNAIQNNAILGHQKHQEVYTLASKYDKKIYRVDDFIDVDDLKKIDKIKEYENLANYLVSNLKLAISALKFLEIEYESKNFYNSKYFGRLTKLSNNIILDVGHNTLASKSILDELRDEKYILIYNSYKDKNYREILTILKPIIKSIEIIEVEDTRIESKDILEKTLNDLSIKYRDFNDLKNDENYLVFGSFSVVESFLKFYDK